MLKKILIMSLVPLFAIGHYFYLDRKPEVQEAERRQNDRQSVALSSGYTSYETANLTPKGPLVVLVSEIQLPAIIWNNTFNHFRNAGSAVLRYDLYGSGLSDKPRVTYDVAFFVRQLAELLAKVAPNREIILLGFSTGGLIASAYAVAHPGKIQRLVLIGATGAGMNLPVSARLIKIPLIGKYLGRMLAGTVVRSIFDKTFTTTPDPAIRLESEQQIRYKGFADALRSSLRNLDRLQTPNTYALLAAKKIPTLIVWGRKDSLVPVAYASELRKIMPHAEVAFFENSGHAPMIDEPDVVHKKISHFISEKK